MQKKNLKKTKKELIEQFEKETGKRAIWRGKETKGFQKWKKKNGTLETRPKGVVKSMETKAKRIAKNKKLLLEKLRDSFGIVKTACHKIGIERKTYYRWYKADKEFAKKCDEIDDSFNLIVDDKIKEGVLNGDSSLIRFHASARNPKYKQKLGIEAGEGVDISMSIKVSDEGADKN